MPKKYTQAHMNEAVDAVRRGNSVYSIAKLYNIPRRTLSDKITGKTPIETRAGRNCYLLEHEGKLVEWINKMSRSGGTLNKTDVLNAAENLVDQFNIKTPFTNGRPGESWFRNFVKRYPNLEIKRLLRNSKLPAVVPEEMIRCWFSELEKELENQDQSDILNDPTRIFNTDLINIELSSETDDVTSICGWKNVDEDASSEEKSTLTFLGTFSAAGEIVTPNIIVPYLRIPKDLAKLVPKGWYTSISETGFMKADTFYEFLSNVFIEWLDEKNIKKPVILFIDGHETHINIAISILCETNGVILYLLPQNTTPILQPADAGLFKYIKSSWKTIVHDFKIQHHYDMVEIKFIAPMLDKVLKKISRKDIINGFQVCGLCPFDPNAVDYTKLIGNVQFNSLSTKSSNISPEQYALLLQVLEQEIDKDILPFIEKDIREGSFFPLLSFVYNNIKMKSNMCGNSNVITESLKPIPHEQSSNAVEENLNFIVDEETSTVEENPETYLSSTTIIDQRPSTSSQQTNSPPSRLVADPLPLFTQQNLYPGNIVMKKGKQLRKGRSKKCKHFASLKRKNNSNKKGNKKICRNLEDWKCNECEAFWDEEENSVETKWIECHSCKKTLHINCIPVRHRRYFNLTNDDSNEVLDFQCESCFEIQIIKKEIIENL